jgi:drug/metabolite transporter (DMT)-like permease
VAAVLYLGIVITGLGYLVWNWALERVSTARAAIYLNVQPLVGALLGVAWLGEPMSVFTVAGGVLVVLGLWLAVTDRPASV